MSLFLAPTPLSRKRIVSCVMLNLLATPGLGSLVARRWFAGIGQTVLSLIGFVLIILWFYKLVIVEFYGQINGEVKVEPVGYIGLAGSGIFVAAWVWSLVTSISLLSQASNVAAESLKQFGASLIKLDENRIAPALAALPEWRRDGGTISRAYTFKDSAAAMQFVNAVAVMAEAAQHHPYMGVRGNQVTLVLTTHDAGGLTELDLAMARECDAKALEN